MTIIDLKLGKLEGYTENGLSIFKGIPYAEPPIGDLRFYPPVAKKPWDGVLNAKEFGSCAFQGYSELEKLVGKLEPESEDCLTLNIWTPGIDNEKRPVMFWIHGGAFIFNGSKSPAYDSAELAHRGNLVVVTINYRLGALGFLYVPGVTVNAGILDQTMALKWVHDNIASFGGDPDNITIFGESAGGYSVIALAAMPLAKGLFHRIIGQSAPTIDPKLDQKPTKTLMRSLGLKSGDIDGLRKISPEKIIEAQNKITNKELLAFRPLIDGEIIPIHPLHEFMKGNCKNIDLLIGTNLNEAKLFTSLDPNISKIDDEKFIFGSLAMMGINLDKAKLIVNTYKNAREGKYSNEPKELLDAIMTDMLFRISTTRLLEAQSVHQHNTYNYLFAWQTPFFNGNLGACHALEIPFVFNSFDDPAMREFVGSKSNVESLCNQMMDAWISFAHTGDPNHNGIPHWPPYDKDKRATFIFDEECRIENAVFEKERKIWDGITEI
ncbi:MAG: carboxylesterase/lipase family protein [Promethearchaeota archaeon]